MKLWLERLTSAVFEEATNLSHASSARISNSSGVTISSICRQGHQRKQPVLVPMDSRQNAVSELGRLGLAFRTLGLRLERAWVF